MFINLYLFISKVIPILQILYHAPDNTSHHIYMSLIILLILSEDESFNKRIHEIVNYKIYFRIFNLIYFIKFYLINFYLLSDA